MGQAGKQSVQSDVGRRNLVTEESCSGLTPGLFTQIKLALQVSKVRQITFLSLRTQHLKCWFAESVGKKQEESGLFAVQRL